MSTDPSIGIEAWEKQRKQWTTPSQDFDKKTYFQKWEAFQFKDLADPKTKVIIYGQLIQKLQSFTQPIPLKYIIPVLVAGWQENGTWPKGVTVKDSSE
ncbi:hypothetical protein BY458DRAFT_485311 [Sporodiniella umbellata]|nr:hypothetical protein BY458DRAFT_485311 [Sporodiniella umbellata]